MFKYIVCDDSDLNKLKTTAQALNDYKLIYDDTREDLILYIAENGRIAVLEPEKTEIKEIKVRNKEAEYKINIVNPEYVDIDTRKMPNEGIDTLRIYYKKITNNQA